MAWEPGSGVFMGWRLFRSFPGYMLPPGLPNGDDWPGLYRSTDGGVTWQKATGRCGRQGLCLTPWPFTLQPVTESTSAPTGGQTWKSQPGSPELGMSAVAIGGNPRLYAGHSAVVFTLQKLSGITRCSGKVPRVR